MYDQKGHSIFPLRQCQPKWGLPLLVNFEDFVVSPQNVTVHLEGSQFPLIQFFNSTDFWVLFPYVSLPVYLSLGLVSGVVLFPKTSERILTYLPLLSLGLIKN